jgi:hypothetical protein
MWHAWKRSAYRVSVGKPEGKRPLGRHRYRWEDTIKMVLERNKMVCLLDLCNLG